MFKELLCFYELRSFLTYSITLVMYLSGGMGDGLLNIKTASAQKLPIIQLHIIMLEFLAEKYGIYQS